jgi:hypothetical protein
MWSHGAWHLCTMPAGMPSWLLSTQTSYPAFSQEWNISYIFLAYTLLHSEKWFESIKCLCSTATLSNTWPNNAQSTTDPISSSLFSSANINSIFCAQGENSLFWFYYLQSGNYVLCLGFFFPPPLEPRGLFGTVLHKLQAIIRLSL